jgi:hypothetical protein
MDEGLPKFSVIKGNIACKTSSSRRVVAALSKYILGISMASFVESSQSIVNSLQKKVFIIQN